MNAARCSQLSQSDRRVSYPVPSELGFCAVLAGFLTAAECAAHIERSESHGFASAESDYPPSYRNNDRVIIDDSKLARSLFERLRGWVPPRLDGDEAINIGEAWHLSGLNERIRFCRYRAGQQFSIHQDGVFHHSPNCESRLTFMIYLTDGDQFEGGDTLFYNQGPGADQPKSIARVRPQAGTLIVFDHCIWHSGEEVTKGTKHIMRSDLLYQRTGTANRMSLQAAHQGYVWTLTKHHDIVASAGRDTNIHLWSKEGLLQRTLSGHSQSVLGLASLEQKYLASGSRDRSLKVWDTSNGVCVQTVQAHSAAVLDVIATRDGFVTSSADYSIKAWSRDLVPLKTFAGHRGWVWSVVLLANDTLLSASEDGTVKQWDISNVECRTLFTHHKPLRAIAIAPDERCFIAGDIQGDVYISTFNKPSPTMRRIGAHRAAVRRLRFLSSELIATTGEDNYVRVWNIASGDFLHEFKRANFATDILAVSPNEYWSSSYDGAIERHTLP